MAGKKKTQDENEGKVVYSFRIVRANSKVFDNPQVLQDFHEELTDFVEKYLPEIRMRDEGNKNKDLKTSSPLYIFVGNGAYALDQIKGDSPTIFPCENLEDVVTVIDRMLNMDNVKSLTVSTMREELREKIRKMITAKGMNYDYGIVYKDRDKKR